MAQLPLSDETTWSVSKVVSLPLAREALFETVVEFRLLIYTLADSVNYNTNPFVGDGTGTGFGDHPIAFPFNLSEGWKKWRVDRSALGTALQSLLLGAGLPEKIWITVARVDLVPEIFGPFETDFYRVFDRNLENLAFRQTKPRRRGWITKRKPRGSKADKIFTRSQTNF